MNTVDVAYQKIKERIFSFTYKPGFQLKEMPLAEELNLTRTPIRKAIARLAHEGLICAYPNRGAFVATLSKQELEDIYEVREALEIKAAHLAIRRANMEELDRIRKALEQRERLLKKGKLSKYYIPEMDFHHEIIRLSKNQTLIAIWESLHTKLKLVRIQSAMVGHRFLDALKEHKEILSHIYQRRHQETEQMLRKHILNAKPDLDAAAADQGKPSVDSLLGKNGFSADGAKLQPQSRRVK